MAEPSRCRSCRIEVDWAQDPAGKPIPLDHASAGDPAGNIAVRRTQSGTLMARYLKQGDELEPGEVRGISHFASCPQAKQWRERGTAGG